MYDARAETHLRKSMLDEASRRNGASRQQHGQRWCGLPEQSYNWQDRQRFANTGGMQPEEAIRRARHHFDTAPLVKTGGNLFSHQCAIT
jgi:hypothetical protein